MELVVAVGLQRDPHVTVPCGDDPPGNIGQELAVIRVQLVGQEPAAISCSCLRRAPPMLHVQAENAAR